MTNLTAKLIPTKDDEPWPSTPGGMVCPVCFSKVPAGLRDKHLEWHQTLVEVFLALGRR